MRLAGLGDLLQARSEYEASSPVLGHAHGYPSRAGSRPTPTCCAARMVALPACDARGPRWVKSSGARGEPTGAHRFYTVTRAAEKTCATRRPSGCALHAVTRVLRAAPPSHDEVTAGRRTCASCGQRRRGRRTTRSSSKRHARRAKHRARHYAGEPTARRAKRFGDVRESARGDGGARRRRRPTGPTRVRRGFVQDLRCGGGQVAAPRASRSPHATLPSVIGANPPSFRTSTPSSCVTAVHPTQESCARQGRGGRVRALRETVGPASRSGGYVGRPSIAKTRSAEGGGAASRPNVSHAASRADRRGFTEEERSRARKTTLIGQGVAGAIRRRARTSSAALLVEESRYDRRVMPPGFRFRAGRPILQQYAFDRGTSGEWGGVNKRARSGRQATVGGRSEVREYGDVRRCIHLDGPETTKGRRPDAAP